MTLTIIGQNKTIGAMEKHEGVAKELVTIKEIKKRNGFVRVEVRIENGKRHTVVSNGSYSEITVQDEGTGRYLLKYNR